MDRTDTLRRPLISNIVQGGRCALFLPVDPGRWVVSAEQLVLLILLEVAMVFAGGLLLALPSPEFYPYGVPVETLGIGLTLLCAVLVSRLIDLPGRLLELCVLLFAISPLILGVGYGLGAIDPYLPPLLTTPLLYGYDLLGLLFLLWVLMAELRVLALFEGGYSRRVLAGLLLFALLGQLLMLYFAEYGEMWYAVAQDETDDEWAAYRALNAEELIYAQRPRMAQALAGLARGETGRTDLYFLGFAGYARENVFRNEVLLAQRIFDQRFGTSSRSLVLINHLDNLQSTPLATSVNLRLALKGIGERMNRDEDILVLFMTSHGSRQHRLSVDFWPLPLNDVSPQMLKTYLDQAGIKWRAVMVSSCYSGGFVQPLQDEHSLIATASASNRSSFGCGKFSDLTYFGEALLRDQLTHSYSMVSALQSAIQAIGSREQQEKLEPSEPQLYVGEAMKTKLGRLESRLRPAECGSQLVAC